MDESVQFSGHNTCLTRRQHTMLWALVTFAALCISGSTVSNLGVVARGYLGMAAACVLYMKQNETAGQIIAAAAILSMLPRVKVTSSRGSVMFLAACMASVLLFAVSAPAEATHLPWPFLHLAMYVVLGYMNPNDVTVLVLVSTVSTVVEIACGGLLFQKEKMDRLTDTICNAAGFLIGSKLTELSV